MYAFRVRWRSHPLRGSERLHRAHAGNQPERTTQCYGLERKAQPRRNPRQIRLGRSTSGTLGRVPASVQITGVSKTFAGAKRGLRRSGAEVRVLDEIDLGIRPGEVVTLLGPSGCGKTTLLRMVAGLEPTSTGSIVVDGSTPTEARSLKQIAFVPESPAVLPWRSVRANASLLLDINRRASPSAPSTSVDDLLSQVGLSEFADSSPRQLSARQLPDGIQERIALARACALDAPVLLLDEPFAALDEITRAEMWCLLGKITDPLATTVVLATDSISEAAFVSDRVAVMSARPGRIVDVIDIDLPRPRHADVENTPEFFETTTRLRRLRDEATR